MCVVNIKTLLITLIAIALPVYATAEKKNTLEEIIIKGIDVTFNAVAGEENKDLLNIDASKLCDLHRLYSRKIRDSPELSTSELECKKYICDTTITQIDSEYFNFVHRILGGRPAVHGEFPHMGALGWKSAIDKTKWVYLCGATLISRNFMLTAAHCSSVPKLKYGVATKEPKIVQLGDRFLYNDISYPNTLKKCYDSFGDLVLALKMHRTHKGQTIDENVGPKYVSIENIYVHPDYNALEEYYDIAIVELEESINFGPLIRPACLWNDPETSSLKKLLITGWGAVEPDEADGINELQVAEVDLIDDITCDELLKIRHNRKWHGLSDHQMCAGFLDGGIDSCHGDSGGPLQVKMNFTDKVPVTKWPMYYQVGVTSFGYKCGRPKTPSVYTKTGSFVDWIEDEVWP